MLLFDYLETNVVKFKDKAWFADDSVPKGMTYSQVDEAAGKVYNYLFSKGLGKEDFVMICLPRGVKPLIAMIGVWKNGSAFVLVEDNYAPERIEFIKNDCGCKLVIDINVWEEILNMECKVGHAEPGMHDAAFAVYTSGTTGNPKGVIHEYGNVDRMIVSTDMTTCGPLAVPEDRFALVAPLNFVASLLIFTYAIKSAAFMYVVSYKTLKNPLLIGMFIITNKITGTFLTPSHIRKMGKKLPGLKFCIIGSEPANEVWMDGLDIHNFYLMSESGFAVAHFLIDHIYEQTPVGGSEFGHKIYLLDEQGNEVPDGEEGEICFENDYVRGYMNLPEQTAEVFKDTGDGKGRLYHSGDLAKRDELGRLIICGRLNDMAKINGNRVEPGEIEGIAKKVLKIDWAAARIFTDTDQSFIALYYKDNITIDEEKVRKEMELYLPYYMIPTFFIHVDQIPLRPNGKMDRKALPKPNFSDYLENYEPPRDEIEKALCDAFAKVLKMERVGIKDDFYQLGGDSLSSMEVITESLLPGLQSTYIFRGHTAEKIAEIYKKEYQETGNIDMEYANKKALEHDQVLTPEQTYMLDYQFYTPKSTMYNLGEMLKFDKEMIDMEKLAKAVDTAIANHPALLTTLFFNEEGVPMQRYSPEIWQGAKVEYISEEELNNIKDTLVQPFAMMKKRLFRCRIFVTEDAGYFFMDVHHIVFDGTSSKVFFGNVLKAYFDQPLEPDYYYYIIRKREKLTWTEFYKESQQYFKDRYYSEGIIWEKHPLVDHKTRENTFSQMSYNLNVDVEKYNKLLKIRSLSDNAFFISASILATAFYNRYKNIMVSWIHNGRGDTNELNTCGLMYHNLPVGVSLDYKMKISELYEEVVDQINKGIEHSCYAAVELNNAVVEDDYQCVLYQNKIRELGEMPGLLGAVDIRQNNAASQNILDCQILNTAEGLKLVLDYASSRFDEVSMERYRDIVGATVEALIKYVDDDNATIVDVLSGIFTKYKIDKFFKKAFMFGWLKK